MPNFPDNPSNGATAVFNGITYTFNGSAWDGTTSSSSGGSSGGSSGVSQITAGNGISVNTSTGNVTVSATGGGGDAKLIDTLAIAGGDDPDTLNNWTTYLQQAADTGGSWIFPDRTYQFNQTIDFNGNNSVWSALTLGQRPEFQWNGQVPQQPTNNGDQAVMPCCMFCDGNIRFYGIRFGVADDSNASLNDAAFLLFQSTVSGEENDSDSSVDWCNFSEIRSTRDNSNAARIVYLGRNFRCTNNVFSSGNEGNNTNKHVRCISLSYGLNANGDTSGSGTNQGSGQNLNSGGYRRTIIRDNTFHLRKNAEAIWCYREGATGIGEHYGLNITGNSIDVGGTLLTVNNGHQLNGAVISGNACFRSHNAPYILMNDGAMRNCAITGNTFVGGNSENTPGSGAEAFSNCIEILGDSNFNRNTITGNTFARPNTACINFQTSVNNIIITGNTFDQDNRTANAINLNGGSGVISSNASNCNVFTSGNLGNFTKVNNKE